MARDRKGSGRRRKRSGGRGGDSTRSRARDMGLDDATIDESGLTDDVAAPDPLKNISGEVDQAKAAEAGAGRGESGEVDVGGEDVFDDEEDNLERAPDEVEVPAGLAATPRRSHETLPAEEEVPSSPRKERGRVLTFLRASWDELQRVQWPDRRQVGQATAVVLGFVLIAGGYLGLMDAIWQPLINAIL